MLVHPCYGRMVWWWCCTEAREKGEWVACFYFFIFLVDGPETPLVRFISTLDSNLKGKTNTSFR